MPTTDELSIERAIRARLEGVELVCEADPTEAELLNAEATCRATFERRGVDELRHRLPATFVSYVVMRGSERYRGNALWQQLGVDGTDSSRVGQAFLAALDRLSLPDFQLMVDREGARRYVAPVLIHGGIPARSAVPLVERIERELRRGLVDGNEAVQRLALDASLVPEVGRPVARLIKHVPAFAADLIDTLIDRITGTPRRGGQHDLPRHIREALERGNAAGRIGLRRITPPWIELDPWSGLGPELVAPDGGRQTVWHLQGEAGQVAVYPGQRTPLAPVDRIAITGEGRRRTLWDHPVLWFDVRSGRLLTSTTVPAQALVLLPPGWRIVPTSGGAVMTEDEGLPLSGAWSRHRLRCVTASGDPVIRLEGPAGVAGAVVRSVLSTMEPTLHGDLVSGLRACDGRQVFRQPPEIRTETTNRSIPVWWTIDGEPTRNAELSAEVPGGRVNLSPVLPSDRVYGLTVEVRGSGDRRISMTCVIDPLTTVDLPTDPLGPNDRCELTVTGPCGSVQRLHAPPLADAILLNAPWAPTGLLEVALPRIRWALRGGRPGRLDLAPATIDASVDDLLGEEPVLIVRSPDGVEIGVVLLVDGIRAQVARPQRARGLGPDRAQVVFPLAVMADTIRSHRARDLRLVLEVAGKHIEAVRSGAKRTDQLPRSWAPALRSRPPMDSTVWESVSWWSQAKTARDVDGKAAAFARSLASLEPGDQVVQFVGRLGGATGDWAQDPTRKVIPGKGPGGVDWSVYEEAAEILWQVQGIRYREFAGSPLEESCLSWARRRQDILRRANTSRRTEVELWSLGRVPTDQQLRDWHLGRLVGASRVGARSRETGTDQLPRALLFQLLLVAAGESSAGGAVVGAVDIDPEGVLGAVALLLEIARRGERLDLVPPLPDLEEAAEPPPPPVSGAPSTPANMPVVSLNRCAVRAEGSTLLMTPPTGHRVAHSAIRLFDPKSSVPIAVLPTMWCDGSLKAEVPPGLHGLVGFGAVDAANVPARLEPRERPVVDLGPSQPRHTFQARSCRFADLKEAASDQLVEDIVLATTCGRLEPELVERLFDDEHIAGAALVRAAERHRAGALDRVGIAILPAATLFSTIVADVASLRAICRNAPILGAALLPEQPTAWRVLGWSNPHTFHAGACHYEDVVHLARLLALKPASCPLETYRYGQCNNLDSERAQQTLRHLDHIGIPRAVIDLAIVTRRALAVDALNGEATRTLLAAYANDQVITTAAVLVGTAITYADNSARGRR